MLDNYMLAKLVRIINTPDLTMLVFDVGFKQFAIYTDLAVADSI